MGYWRNDCEATGCVLDHAENPGYYAGCLWSRALPADGRHASRSGANAQGLFFISHAVMISQFASHLVRSLLDCLRCSICFYYANLLDNEVTESGIRRRDYASIH